MRRVDLIQLMGPPGSGKSTLGRELDRQGVVSYTELEPILVERFGRGEEFARHRPKAHEWIWSFYRRALQTSPLPVAMETTGIAGRDFLEEIQATGRVLLIKLTTPREVCVSRALSRPKGAHVTDHGRAAAGRFFDHWHGDVAPTYAFDLCVSGTDLDADVESIKACLGEETTN